MLTRVLAAAVLLAACAWPASADPAAGGNGGQPYDDGPYLPKHATVREIVVRSGDDVDSLQFVWTSDSSSPPHGGQGGTESVVEFGKGEFVRAIEGYAGSYLYQVTIVTNLSKYGPFGQPHDDGRAFVFKATPGTAIVGIKGRCAMLVDQLTPIYQRLTPDARQEAHVAQSAPIDITGDWSFTHAAGQFSGKLMLEQNGTVVSGVWRTITGKNEPDTAVSGRLQGRTLYLRRFLGGNLQQTYMLTVSSDDDHIDGKGTDGFFAAGVNLNLSRMPDETTPDTPAVPAPAPPAPKNAGWKWAIQGLPESTGTGIDYRTYSFASGSNNIVSGPLALTDTAVILSVAPDGPFVLKDDKGDTLPFDNEAAAAGKTLTAGAWTIDSKSGATVTVYLK